MSHILVLDLPDEAFAHLQSQASLAGVTPEQWLVRLVAPPAAESQTFQWKKDTSEDAERRRAAFRAMLGCFKIEDPDWSDNDRIDAELARYANREGK